MTVKTEDNKGRRAVQSNIKFAQIYSMVLFDREGREIGGEEEKIGNFFFFATNKDTIFSFLFSFFPSLHLNL